MLMNLYLEEDFRPEYLKLAANIRSEEYYVNMMIAWYLADGPCKAMGDDHSVYRGTTSAGMGTP